MIPTLDAEIATPDAAHARRVARGRPPSPDGVRRLAALRAQRDRDRVGDADPPRPRVAATCVVRLVAALLPAVALPASPAQVAALDVVTRPTQTYALADPPPHAA